MSKLRFLLLEDSPADAELLSTTLDNSDLDCAFYVVETQADFEKVLRSEAIDVVLADYSLPTFNGIRAIEIVRSQCPDIPCILVSGVLGEERAIEALKSGAADYVLKQRLERLVPCVKRALSESRERHLLARAAAELKRSEAQFRTSIETMMDCFVLLAPIKGPAGTVQDFAVEYINETACQYLMVNRADLIGESIYALVPGFKNISGVDLTCELSWVLENGQPYEQELYIESYESEDRAVAEQFAAVDMRAVRLDDGIILTWRDITARKRKEQRRQQRLDAAEKARHQALQANQHKDEFLLSFSHQLQSPLSDISGWLQLLETNPHNPKTSDKALEVIQCNAKLLEHLATDLLEASRIAQGKFPIVLQPLALSELSRIILDVINTLLPASRAKDVAVVFATGDLSGQIFGDAARLQQVIHSLLANAIEFAYPHGEVTIEIVQQERAAVISIKGDGQGMSPSELPHIFESFWRAERQLDQHKYGIGLSLPIARYIVDTHQGEIKAESEGIDQGSTFTLEFPLLTSPEDASGISSASPRADTVAEASEDCSLKGVRVLVVDDEVDSLDVCTIMLETYDAEVKGATSAAEALEVLEQFHPHVLVSDIGMPDENGYVLIRQVRSRPAASGGNIPAIALTAYTETIYQTRALLAGFQRHIAKPVDFQALVELVAELAQLDARAGAIPTPEA